LAGRGGEEAGLVEVKGGLCARREKSGEVLGNHCQGVALAQKVD
jgi:hypothetical protein